MMFSEEHGAPQEPEARPAAEEQIANEVRDSSGSVADRLYRRAKKLSEEGALRDAVGVYRELLTLDPNHLRAHNNLGVLYDRMGDHRAALTEYLAAEALDPDDVRLQCNIAAMQASLGHYREAKERLEQALHADPKNADARENLGLVYFKKGLYGQAAEELRRATELDESRGSAYLYLGEALNHMDDVDGAMAALERSIELRPNARAFYALGIIYDRKKQPDLAEVMYRKAKELGGW